MKCKIIFVFIILMLFSVIPAYASDIPGDGIITTDGDYQLPENFAGTIIIQNTASQVTVVGYSATTPHVGTQIVLETRTTPLELTVKDLNIIAEEDKHGIDFAPAGDRDNKLYVEGSCKIIGDANGGNAGNATYGAGIHVPENTRLTIEQKSGSIEAKLESIGGDCGAGIGGGVTEAGGHITIAGGEVTATGGFQAAGIGGSSAAGGQINITGGKVIANGGFAGAGIGGGNGGAGGNIQITGGEVRATGGIGVVEGQYDGAGIGGGNGGAGGTITITNQPVIIAIGRGGANDLGNGMNSTGSTTLKNASDAALKYVRATFKNASNANIAATEVKISQAGSGEDSYTTTTEGVAGLFLLDNNENYTVNIQGYQEYQGLIAELEQSNAKQYVLAEQASPVTISVVKNNTTYGGSNGSITVTASGGNGTYEYTADNGVNWQNEANFTGLNADTYQVKARDKADVGNESSMQSVEISQPAGMTISIAKTDVTTYGGNDGSITVTASGGNGTYEYSVDNGTNWQNEASFTGLCVGTYQVKARDKADVGNESSSQSVEIGEYVPLNITTDGEYQLPENFAGTIIIQNTASQVTVVGYSATTPHVGTQIVLETRTTPLELTVKDLNIIAEEDKHGIDFAPAGDRDNKLYIEGSCKIIGDANGGNAGNATYGAGIHVPENTRLTIEQKSGSIEAKLESIGGDCGAGIGGGVTEAGGHITIAGGEVTATGGFQAAGIGGSSAAGGQINITGGKVIANGGFAGAGIGGGNGGAGGNIQITGGEVRATGGIGVVEGQYDGAGIGGGNGGAGGTITITNQPVIIAIGRGGANDLGNGMNSTGSTTLKNASDATLKYVRATFKNASNANIAATEVKISQAGSGEDSYTTTTEGVAGLFLLDNNENYTVNIQGYQEYQGLIAELEQSNAKQYVLAEQASPVTISVVKNNTTYGGSNGSITVTASGGNGTYEYTADNGASWQNEASFTDLSAGTYQVKARDKADVGNESSMQSVEISQPAAVIITVTKTDVTTYGGNDGSITVTASGGNGTYEYSVDNGTNWQNEASFTGLCVGTYQVKARDKADVGNESSSQSVEIGEYVPLNITTDGEYQLPENFTGTIPIQNTASQVTVVGYSATTPHVGTQIVLETRTIPLELTVKDLNIIAEEDKHGIDFAPAGDRDNKLYIEGSCKIIGDANGGNAGNATYGAGIHVPENTRLTIEQKSGSIEAKLESIGGDCGAGIGGGVTEAGGHITIAGGEVTATGGFQAAGIGGSSAAGGQINITGGKVIANGGFAGAGIGGGNGGAGGNIQITGGEVRATGGIGVVEGQYDGAGIGGGNGGAGGTITITNQPVIIAIGRGGANDLGNGMNSTGSTTLKNASDATLKYVRATFKNASNANIAATEVKISQAGSGEDSYTTTTEGVAGLFLLDNNENYTVNIQGYQEYQGLIAELEQSNAKQYVLAEQASPVTISIAKTDVTTYGGSDGSITVTAIGGKGTYEYSVDNGASWQNEASFADLSAGTYQVKARDKADVGNESSMQSVEISQPAAVIITITKTDVTTYGGNDGSITVTASGGNGTYEYSVDNGTNWQNEASFTGLCVGTYQVKARDKADVGNESSSQSVEIGEYVPLNITTDGEYQLPENFTGTIPIQNTASQVTVVGYSATTPHVGTQIVLETRTIPLELTVKDLNIIAEEDKHGIDFAPAGDRDNKLYIEGSCKIIGDANGGNAGNATYGAGIHVPENTRLTIEQKSGSIEAKLESIGGDCGAGIGGGVTEAGGHITIAGGEVTATGGFQAAGIGGSSAAGGQINITGGKVIANGGFAGAGIGGGNGGAGGTITITNQPVIIAIGRGGANDLGNGMNSTGSTTLKNASDATLKYVRATFKNASNANIAATEVKISQAGSGEDSYTTTTEGVAGLFLLDNNENYTVNIQGYQEYQGLIAELEQSNAKQYVLAEQASPVTISIAKTDVTTYGGSDGIITVTASGGNGTYEYSADNGASWQNESGFTGLSAGTNRVKARDKADNGNESSVMTVEISQPTAVTITITKTDVTTYGGSNGSITVTASGGKGTYEYSVDNGTNWQNEASFTDLSAGTYQVKARDKADVGNESSSQSVEIGEYVPLNITTDGEYQLPENFTGTIPIQNTASQVTVVGYSATTPHVGTQIVLETRTIPLELTVKDLNIIAEEDKHGIDFAPAGDRDNKLYIEGSCKIIGDANGGNAGNATYGAGIHVPENTRLTIEQKSGSIEAKLESIGGDCGAGIGGGVTEAGGHITIAGGEVTATGGFQAAGIGGSSAAGGQINITGGKVIANGGFAGAGIGGGNGGAGGNIQITGGEVRATGGIGVVEGQYDGAGIGGGNGGAGGTITITNQPVIIAIGRGGANDLGNGMNSTGSTTLKNASDATLKYVRATFKNASNANIAATEVKISQAGSGEDSYTTTTEGVAGLFLLDNNENYTVNIQGYQEYQGLIAELEQSNAKQYVLAEQASPVTISVVKNNTTYGGSNGSITVTASGGNGTYEYTADNGASWQNEASFTDLSAGTYQVKARDKADVGNESSMQSVEISQPAAVIITITKTDVTTYGGSNGSITVTASGGKGTYEYSVDNGTNWQNEASFTGLCVGTYQVKARDKADVGNESSSQSIEISQPTGVTISIAKTDVTTYGGSDGIITVTASGGNGTYEYSADNGASWQNESGFTGLSAGTNRVKARDKADNGNESSVMTVEISQPTAVTITITKTDVTAYGGSNGSITVTASGGKGTYEYSVDNGTNWQNEASFTDLSAGTYQVKARDKADVGNESSMQSVEISQPAAVTITITKTDVTIYGGSDGSITVTASGGNGTYEYSADNGASWQNESGFTGLSAGTNRVKARDKADNGNESSVMTVEISQPTAVTITITKTDVTTYGGSNGSITVTASGGKGTYEYSVDNGTNWQNEASFTGLCVGTYQVKARDKADVGNESSSQSIEISQPTGVTISIAKTDVTTYGGSDGIITVTASGGNGTYEYSADNGASWQNESGFTGLSAGTNRVKARDKADNGNESSVMTVEISQPTAVTITITKTDVTTYGGSNGSITVTASGGKGTYEYSVDNGTNWQNEASFTDLSAGTYQVKARDKADVGNESSMQSIEISQPTGVTISIAKTDVTTYGGSDGSITITAIGGKGTYEYSVDNGASWQNEASFTDLSAGTYQVKARDKADVGNESSMQSVEISQPAAVTITITKTDVTTYGGSDGIITVTASGGNGTYEYSADNGASWQNESGFTGLGVGTYQVKARDKADVGNESSMQSIEISQPTGVTISIAKTDVTTYGGSDGSITVTASGGKGTYEYSVDNGVSWQNQANFTGLSAGTYQVRTRDRVDICNYSGLKTVVISQPSKKADESTDEKASVIAKTKSSYFTIGTMHFSTEQGRRKSIIKTEREAIEKQVEYMSERESIDVGLKVNTDIVETQLSFKTIIKMQSKAIGVSIQTDQAVFSLASDAIDLLALKKQFGEITNYDDIRVSIKISKPEKVISEMIEQVVTGNQLTVVVPAIEFDLEATYADKRLKIEKLKKMTSKLIAIPKDTDISKVTTCIIVDKDNTIRSVPTRIIEKNGQYYAEVKSIVSSTYVLIQNNKTFLDIQSHWAREEIEKMSEALIVENTLQSEQRFAPNEEITRGELIAIIVKSIGIKPESTDQFLDTKNSKYQEYVGAAYNYGIAQGTSPNRFSPHSKVTRQDTMVIIYRLAKLIEYQGEKSTIDISQYQDSNRVSAYAKEAVQWNIENEIIKGKANNILAPKQNITRAEIAVIINRLLKKVKLI